MCLFIFAEIGPPAKYCSQTFEGFSHLPPATSTYHLLHTTYHLALCPLNQKGPLPKRKDRKNCQIEDFDPSKKASSRTECKNISAPSKVTFFLQI